jgi:hypothetical protein
MYPWSWLCGFLNRWGFRYQKFGMQVPIDYNAMGKDRLKQSEPKGRA